MSIRKIAKLAGVSTSTVSRVINHHPYVKEDKRQRVLEVMKEIDYVPNQNAINLSNGKSNIIGLVVPYIRNSCYDQLVESILEEATKEHQKVMILPTYFDQELEKNYYTLLRDKTVDGIIVTSKTQDDDFLSELSQYGPIITTEKTRFNSTPSVYPDRVSMFDLAFDHLAKLTQYKKIFVTVHRSKSASYSTERKMTSFAKYFPHYPIEDAFLIGLTNFENGYILGQKLFAEFKEPFILYGNGDEVAAGVYKASLETNYQMNRDFYLISEDNQLFSDIFSIDSLDFHLKEVGKRAVHHLLNHETSNQKIMGHFEKRQED
ncbi:LacI family DNA-binding transcriptional regulator [Vagococcus hydrophili]|uniref:LacI family transcriptional regulator n=1 Tax=Vagococcus hydrophili TaxID=2714947 RepID=A0A6G8AWK9_9ENTE|nr:LacI family DNA-binding transcriptional regulator [Vagococcus hydrophili]QIL49444.1 LacI family transcriptional regulator [Vagococcus hydrophili]